MRSASAARLVWMWGCLLQPTTRRLNRSIEQGGYSRPSSVVAMQMMSLLHTRSGSLGVKSLASRFSATGKLCLLPVVATNFLLPRALMPCAFMSP